MINIEYNKIIQDTSSFQLVRTNPKLTSNVKLTVDTADNMWLDSFEVSSELANDIYKRFPIDTTIDHSTNVYNFYDDGNTPPEIAFFATPDVDLTKTSNDFKNQYDFAHYFSGARYFPSKQYEEKLSYFAPLYIKKDLPDYFIVMKIDDPINYKIDASKDKYPFDKEDYLVDMFKKASTIKTFDLSEGSKVGAYLRKYISDINFPVSPLNVNFENDSYTDFNGILLDSGAFGTRSEILDDFYSESSPLKYFEKFVTGGFERNGIIYPNILNIEFIFDDDSSEIYDFNRYVGFYINKIELDKIQTDIDRVYENRSIWENTPRLRRNIKDYEDINVIQNNASGVEFPYEDTYLKMSEFKDTFLNKENFFMNYIDDKDGNLYTFKLGDSPIDEDTDSFGNELPTGKITLSNTEINLGKFFGPGRDFIQDEAFSTTIRGFSNSYLKILGELNNLDSIKIYHPSGTQSDLNGKFDELIATIGYALVPNSGDYYYFNDIDNVNGNDTFYFNATGTVNEIASAISGCLNNIRSRSYKLIDIEGGYLFIKASAAGDHDTKYGIEFYSDVALYDNIEIGQVTGSNLIGNLINFDGGSKESGNRLIMDADQLDKLNANLSSVLIRTVNGWSKIRKISNYVDTVSIGDTNVNDYFEKIAIILDLNEAPYISFNESIIKLMHTPSFGFISFLPIRDFDFDFYTSDYLNFPINDLYKFYYIPENTPLLKPGEFYQVFGNGVIEFNGMQYSSPDIFDNTTGSYQSYTIVSGNPVVSYPSVLSGNNEEYTNVPISDQNNEVKDFEGFFLLKDPSKVTTEETTDESFNRRGRYLNGIAQTEYDYYKENYNKEFALDSKMLPYITKWSLLNGKDSRSNPYRLNTELIFGFNNFSPSHDDTTQNPSNFTHEWYYLESAFDYTRTADTLKLNNSYFDKPLDMTRLLAEEDYFVNYFTYTPTFNSIEVGKTQTRYSIVSKNEAGEFQTFIKGFKTTFSDVISITDIGADGKPIANPNTNRFEDYKFSTILRVIKEDINDATKPPIDYKYIEHKDFKFILLIVDVYMGTSDNISPYWLDDTIQNTDVYPIVDRTNFLDPLPAPYGSTLSYNSINGDYRINISTDIITGLDISDITYSLLYSLKHKKYNTELNRFSNIKLSSKLDLSFAGTFLGVTTDIERLNNPNIPNYPSSLSDEITTISESSFIMPTWVTANVQYFIDKLITTPTPLNINGISSISNNKISLTAAPNNILIDDSNAYASNIPTLIPTIIYSDQYVFKSMVSGENYYEKVIEKLSFARFKEYVNELNPFIEYESYYLDSLGVPTLENEPKYYVNIPDNEVVIKKSGIGAFPDDNKPSNFSFTETIGYNYLTSKLTNYYEINRYIGGYEPIFTDVMFYNSNYTFTQNNINPIELGNIKFNINVNTFGTILNFNHLKISNTKILDLEASDSYEPVYELINEIAIDKKPYFLFDSNWEFGFHHRYVNKTTSRPVAGTLRVEEDDSFIGKLITLPGIIELENFKVVELSETQLLDNVNLNNIEIVSKETSTEVIGYININNVLTRYLIDSGIAQKFDEYLVNEEQYLGAYENIEDYVKQYISSNIIKLYELIDINFYTKTDKKLVSSLQTPANSNNIDFISLTDKQRQEQGYAINKNLEINKYERLILRFNFKKKLKGGTLISPKIKIKFI